MIIYMFTLQVFCLICAITGILQLRKMFAPSLFFSSFLRRLLSYIKSRPHKNMFFSVAFEHDVQWILRFFLGSLVLFCFFSKKSHWSLERRLLERVTDRVHQSLMSFLQDEKKKERATLISSHRSLVLLYVLRCTEMSFSMQVVRLSCKEPCRVLVVGRPSSLRQ